MNTSNKITKYLKTSLLGLLLAALFITLNPETAKTQSVDAGFDLYSTYVWRGVAYSGPSLQPYVEYSSGGFAVGAWGSQGYDGFQEMDLYAGYEFDFGLSLGVTDYYYPGSMWLDGDSHAIEINAGYGVEDLSLSANFIVNEAAGAGSAGSDLYFEAGYALGAASVFLGAGDGWHSSDGEFALVNLGVSTGKEIVITETFSIPLSGAVVFNPDSEQLYILAGISF
jgi:uncharacterized protein (TIGR02001 family)